MSIGLADALNKIGKKTMIALREPSLGPVMGIKGGAAGGGKTDLLLGLALTSQEHSIIFRREAVQLIGIEERMTAIRAAKVMGLSVAGVDILRSNHGPLVLEVNSSPGLEGIETTTGKDVAGLIIEHLEKNSTPHMMNPPRATS